MKCPLCGYEFDETELGCVAECPLSADCQMICCPHCGFQGIDPNRSMVVGWFQRLQQRLRGEKVPQAQHPTGEKLAAVPLSQFPKGRWARVAHLAATRDSRLQRLSALGIAPGSRVRLQQHHPAYVVQVGNLELALDAEIAGEIFVTAEGSKE